MPITRPIRALSQRYLVATKNRWGDQSPLAYSVSRVIRFRPEKQVIGIYACWYVTTMQYTKAMRNRAVLQHPGDSMRTFGPLSPPAELEATVSRSVQTTAPYPAFVGDADAHLGPEAVLQWY